MKKLPAERKKWIWNKLIPGIIFFGGFTLLLIRGQWNQHLIRTYPRYAIGTTIKTYWTFSSGKQIEYGFSVRNKYYKDSDRYNEKSKVPEGRYYVKFYVKDPDICVILQDRPVPDNITSAPAEGWEEIPQ